MDSSEERILLAHGSGGELSHQLVASLFAKSFQNPLLQPLDDSAVFLRRGGEMGLYHGQLRGNPDLLPRRGHRKAGGLRHGQRPRHERSPAPIFERRVHHRRGIPFFRFKKNRPVHAEDRRRSRSQIVTGDTKVVNRGAADGVFINTAGIGRIPPGIHISGHNARPGDKVLVSGTMGDHGVAILSAREGLEFSTSLVSDCAPLNPLVEKLVAVSPHIHCLRDPTRGGLSSTLNELARQSGVGIWVEENRIPVKEEVRGACELLGFEPWNLANEGKLVAIVEAEAAEAILRGMKDHPLGRDAAMIGEVKEDPPGKVVLRTPIGSTRLLDMMVGEPLPRIC